VGASQGGAGVHADDLPLRQPARRDRPRGTHLSGASRSARSRASDDQGLRLPEWVSVLCRAGERGGTSGQAGGAPSAPSPDRAPLVLRPQAPGNASSSNSSLSDLAAVIRRIEAKNRLRQPSGRAASVEDTLGGTVEENDAGRVLVVRRRFHLE